MSISSKPIREAPLCVGSRREFLWQMGAGFAGVALTALLDQDGFFATQAAPAGDDGLVLAPVPEPSR